MLRAIKLTMAALTLCLTISTLSSFTNDDDTDWYYHGSSDPEEFTNPDNWTKIPVAGVTCGSGTRPCHIMVNAADDSELEILLSGYDEESIFDIASARS